MLIETLEGSGPEYSVIKTFRRRALPDGKHSAAGRQMDFCQWFFAN
jgi:hypothetical protein